MKTNGPHSPHTWAALHCQLQRLIALQKTQCFALGLFPLKHTPCSIHAAMAMRFAALRGKPARSYGHGNRTWQQSCSHCVAICNNSFQNTLYIRPHDKQRVAEHPVGTIRRWKRMKGYNVWRPGFPCNIHAAMSMRFAGSRGKPACICGHGSRTWQQLRSQPFHCDLQPQTPKHPFHTHTWLTTPCRTPCTCRCFV